MKFSIFEVIMLLCFGFSWPFAILKTLKVKNPKGKSYIFLSLIIIGYIAGCLHKAIYHNDLVLYLYMLNGVLVALDMFLCIYYQFFYKKNRELQD